MFPLVLPLLAISTISLFIILITKQIRYGSGREVILNLFCDLKGRRHRWVTDPTLARRLLGSSSSKGIGIEHLLSFQAFRPIVSLESVNDSQWMRMKENFLTLKTHLPPLEKLAEIAENKTTQYLNSDQILLIDSPTLVKILVEIMQAWLFHGDSDPIPPALLSAIEEWRKEIAVKGRGDPNLKLFAVNWIQHKIRGNYYHVFEENWSHEEYWSLLLQPFFVSPAINLADIATTLASSEFREEFGLEGKKIDKGALEGLLLSGIRYNHPFPVLERWYPDGLKDGDQVIVDPNTHVFIPMDKIGREGGKVGEKWVAFGVGKRACGGREVAMTLCTNIFYPLMTHEKAGEKFKPWVGHAFSGRNNDQKETWRQTWFQVKLLVKILWRLVLHKE
ncbi:uncharacterized protein LOC110854520 [Folsomia candida]|uniref:uncharacterized protein LOC110854520 n=1 Tax=Folsomia candida TaxID=158441 RepID=UPI000B90891D|nr:uncharacterized protein LOC110854520 [Folsomia candida]